MKQELISLLQVNCLLPRWAMVTWINSLVFTSESNDAAIRQEIIAEIKSNGQLTLKGWKMLIENVVLDSYASITMEIAVSWLPCPTCNQLKQLITDFKLANNYKMVIYQTVLDALDVNMQVAPEFDINKNFRLNNGQELNIRAKSFELLIRNFTYLQGSSPYLVIERYTNAKKKSGRYAGWKRDKTLMVADGTWHNGWKKEDFEVAENNGYRPNEIAIQKAKQDYNIRPENYVFLGLNNLPQLPTVVSQNSNNMENNYLCQRVKLRLRIAYKMGGYEKISKPLVYFSIFAQRTKPDEITVSYSKV